MIGLRGGRLQALVIGGGVLLLTGVGFLLLRPIAPPDSGARRGIAAPAEPRGNVRDLVPFRVWGALPAFGPFAVVDPEGQGRHLSRYSWGWPGQIADLARMPAIVQGAIPGLRIDRSRIYAIGSSMGGQETLLLVARYPRLLAGAAALDSATNMAALDEALPHGIRS